jgi:hypothetical protein
MLDFCTSGYPNLLLIAPVDIDPGNSRSGGPEMWNAPPAGFAAALTDPDTIRDLCPRGGDRRPPAQMPLAGAGFHLAARGSRTREFHGYETVHRLFAGAFRRCDQRHTQGPSVRQARGRLAGQAGISGCHEDQLRGGVMQWKRVYTQTSLLVLTSTDAFIICDARGGLPREECAPAERPPPAGRWRSPLTCRPHWWPGPLPERLQHHRRCVMSSPPTAPAAACQHGLSQRKGASQPPGAGALTAALAGHESCPAP